MRIEREKFFALTATMAGFWPTAACGFSFGGGAAAPVAAEAARASTRTEEASTGAAGPAVAARATCAKLRP